LTPGFIHAFLSTSPHILTNIEVDPSIKKSSGRPFQPVDSRGCGLPATNIHTRPDDRGFSKAVIPSWLLILVADEAISNPHAPDCKAAWCYARILKRVPSGRSCANDDAAETIERGCRAILPATTTTTGERSMIRCQKPAAVVSHREVSNRLPSRPFHDVDRRIESAGNHHDCRTIIVR
jgi:hypothetical protein